jgi:polysaccharide biosynthesis transport protein
METMSLLALPYFPDWTEDELNEFMRPSPVSASAKVGVSPKSIHKTYPTQIHRPKLVVLPKQSVVHPPMPSSVYSTTDHSQRRVVVAAGVAIAVTAGALTQCLSQAPVYEGSVQLAAQTVNASSRYISTPQAQPNIAAPSLMLNFSTEVLTSQLLLEPVVQQLNLPQLTYQSLVKNLTLTSENGLISLRYRDADPQRVQLVLDQITQVYVNYGQTCQGNACRGVQHVEAQIPQSQARLQQLGAEIEQLHQRYGVSNLQAQRQLLEARITDVTKQEAQLQGTLAAGQQTYQQLQQQVSGNPAGSENVVQQLLSQDARYRSLLSQFQTLDQQLGNQFANLGGGDRNDLRSIQAQHQRVMNQLSQEAQSVLPQYLANPASNTQNPIFQNAIDLQLLQQSILTFNSLQIMQARQETLGQAKQNLEQQRSQLIKLLGQYERLKTKLDLETNALQRHFAQLKILQKQAQPEVTLKVTDAPDVMRNQQGQPIATIPDLQRNLGIGAVLGVLAGIGVSAALERKRSQTTSTDGNISVDVLMNRAKELADMRLRSQFTQAA